MCILDLALVGFLLSYLCGFYVLLSCLPRFEVFLLKFNVEFFLFLGFNVETVEYKNISFTVWDVGGQDKVHILTLA